MLRADPYHWMRDADSSELLAHLVAERRWYDTSVAHLLPFVATLQAEMVSRLPSVQLSPPWHRPRFSYYTRQRAGSDYAQLLREIRTPGAAPLTESGPDAPDDDEKRVAELVLDPGSLVTDSGYLDLGVTSVSPCENLLAYSVDRTGDEVFGLRFRDLRTGTDLAEEIPRSYYGGAWSADSAWFFYTVHDTAYRPFQVWRHRLGTPAGSDVLVLSEPDERFEVSLRGARTGDIVVWSESSSTSEVWVLDATDATRPPRSVGGRRPGVRYHAEPRRLPDGSTDLLVVTNDRAVEFRLMTAPVPSGDQDADSWREARSERRSDRLLRADAFAAGVVLTLRRGGTQLLELVPHDGLAGATGSTEVTSALPGGEVTLATSPLYEGGTVTVRDESWLQPPVWTEWDLRTGLARTVRANDAPGFDPARYLTERRTFPSADGTAVPVTLMRHRDTPLDGTAPVLLYGYGAYEAVFEPEWDPALPSLLDRGVVYAFAHLRGGGEMGRQWYLDGKLAHKQHTFDDHVAVADGLASAGLVDPGRIATRGLSAGGLLQGAVFNQRPDRWCAVVAEVPFVDVVTTMFDEATPLTVAEWEEWGDPRIREEFDWMLAYSPYENPPPAGTRPDLLVTGALHDPRVMVREPAKWVAALRAGDPAWSPRCLFRAETGAGAHVGPSGRLGHLAYEAEIHAWVLDRLGLAPGAAAPGSEPEPA